MKYVQRMGWLATIVPFAVRQDNVDAAGNDATRTTVRFPAAPTCLCDSVRSASECLEPGTLAQIEGTSATAPRVAGTRLAMANAKESRFISSDGMSTIPLPRRLAIIRLIYSRLYLRL